MSQYKNSTDKQFRDRLRNIEMEPPVHVWHGITAALQADRRRQRVIWVRRIAASLAVILAVGMTWLLLREPVDRLLVNYETQDNTDIQGTEETSNQAMKGNGEEEGPVIKSDKDDRLTRPSKMVHPGVLKVAEEVRSAPAVPSPGEKAEWITNGRSYVDPLKAVQAMPAEVLQTDVAPPVDLLAVNRHPSLGLLEHKGIDVFEEWGDDRAASPGKWGVGTQVSPIYSYRNLEASGGIGTDASYYNEIEEGIVSYAGGVNVQYAPLKRLSVQSGIYYSSMGMKVGNAYYATTDNSSIYGDEATPIQASIDNSTGIIETQQDLGNTYVANTVPQAGVELTARNATINAQDSPKGEILQQFEYLEVPLIFRYRVIDRRLGFHFLGGFSSNFLVDNTAYYQEGGDKEPIGTTGNLRPINYSSVLGLGLDYSISKRFHVNLEPTLRYYLNPINTGSMIRSHPYTIGFFTGLLYTF